MNFRIVLLLPALLLNAPPARSSVDHTLFDMVLRQHVVNGEVDYQGIANDGRFANYLKLLGNVKPDAIVNKQDRLAFWINAYNAFTIKLIIDNHPVKSIRDIVQGNVGPWDLKWVDIDGRKLSLNQIEHDIIRKEFDEPRIHVALVCAAVSCPPLRSEAYTGNKLESQLENNAETFLRDSTKNRYDMNSNTLFLSELFSWYGDDFNTKYASAVGFVMQTLGISPPTPPSVKYLPYDWSLNAKQR